MRVANVAGRAAIVDGDLAFDLAEASGCRFGPTPQDVFDHWDEVREWASQIDWPAGSPSPGAALDPALCGPPSPTPRQVLAIGVNYASHAAEANLDLPQAPVVFTKFPSCLAGPTSEIPLPSDNVDWEVELVAVIGRQGTNIPAARAWDFVAGVTVGQDISERVVQTRPPVAQFSLGKSFPAFGTFGPTVVSVDELGDPDDIELRCWLNGELMQKSSTSDLIFTVPELLAYLSSIVTLYPGDILFTGTPSGVGGSQDPPRYLRPGDVLVSEIPDVARMENRCVANQGGVR
jgi:2-keto-4-pentenoate hydratase/2-oxohepta-3-ene-1,7-dioic acid hydratase in catechol pathway